jgi:hypothetical protein
MYIRYILLLPIKADRFKFQRKGEITLYLQKERIYFRPADICISADMEWWYLFFSRILCKMNQ